MAPRKEKNEKLEKAEDGCAMILEYLRQQNRPYSAIDISANLHNKVTKTYAAKALKEMHEKKQVEGRASGKQIVYHTLQDPADEVSLEDLAAIDREIECIKDQVSSAKAQEKVLRLELAAISSRVSTSELRERIAALEKEKDEVLSQLAHSKGDTSQAKVVSAEERALKEKEWKTWQRNVGVRKRVCSDMWMKCTEVLPDTVQQKEELWEALGLEGSL